MPVILALLFLVTGHWLLVTAFCPAAPEAERLVEQALESMFEVKDYGAALDLLKKAREQSPSAYRIYEWLGYAYAALGEHEQSVQAYQMAIKLRNSLPKANAAWFPPFLFDRVLKLHPARFETIVMDVHLPSRNPSRVGGASSPAEAEAQDAPPTRIGECPTSIVFGESVYPAYVPTIDPKFGFKFNRMLPVYVKSGNAWKGLARIYYPAGSLSASRKDWHPLAQQTARLLSLVHALMKETIGYEPEEGVKDFLDVWLCEETPEEKLAGLSTPGSIYLFQTSKPRSKVDWIELLSHEYGHHALPSIRPLQGAAEPDSGGYLSERLVVLWLYALTEGGKLKDVVDEETASHLREVVATKHLAEIKEVAERLGKGELDRIIDGARMRNFLGLALYVERTYGASTLRLSFELAPDESFQGFLNGLYAALRRKLEEGSLSFQPRSLTPEPNQQKLTPETLLRPPELKPKFPLDFVAWLPQGTFQLSFACSDPTRLYARVRGGELMAGGVVEGRAHFSLSVKEEGWHLLSLRALGNGIIRLDEINFAFKK